MLVILSGAPGVRRMPDQNAYLVTTVGHGTRWSAGADKLMRPVARRTANADRSRPPGERLISLSPEAPTYSNWRMARYGGHGMRSEGHLVAFARSGRL